MTKARKLADLGNVYDDGALSNRNLIINGKCSVNQKGTNTGTNVVTGPDRFFIHSSNPSGHVIEASSQKDGPSGFNNCFQYKTTTAVASPAADQYTGFAHKFEVQDVIPYIWSGNSHVTASFWVKSSIAGTFTFNINPEEATGGGSADRILYESTYTINSTNTWEYKTITIPLSFLSNYALLSSYPDNTTGLEITWVMDIISGGNRTDITTGWNTPASEARNMVTSTGGNTGFFTTVNSTFRITGIQFEVGDTATPFEHRSYGDELAKCQRYYQHTYGTGIAVGTATHDNMIGSGGTHGNTTTSEVTGGTYTFKVEMRAAPTITFYDHLGNSARCSRLNAAVAWYGNSNVGTSIATTTSSVKPQSPNGSTATGMYCHIVADVEL